MCDTDDRADVIAARWFQQLEWTGEVLPLEPVDELSVLSTISDNTVDILLPDQGPAKRLPLAGMARLAPPLEAPTILGGKAADVPLAQHGFSALVEVRKGGQVRLLLFDTGHDARRVRRQPAPPGPGSGRHRGDRLQPRPLRPHHRAIRPDRPARPGEPAGADPPRVLGPAPPGHSRRAVRAAHHQPPRAGRRRLRHHRAAAAVVPVRPVSADHRGGRPGHRIREGVRGPPGLARPELGARPADPGRSGADRPRRRPRSGRAHRLRARGHHQHLPLRPAPDRRGEAARRHRRLHLAGPLFEPVIGDTVNALEQLAPEVIVPAHCTGWKATHAIARRLPGAFIQNSVGTTFHLTAATAA